MGDPSERHGELLECGCEFAQGTWFYCSEHQPRALDLRAVEAKLRRLLDLYRDVHSHARSDNPDVVRADIFALAQALLAHCRALRAELDLARQAIEILRDIWMQDFGGHGLPNLAQHRIESAAAVLARATDTEAGARVTGPRGPTAGEEPE